ncbi:PulJ/GspJ family protein [Planococcus plakortidis]|uniref:PulJ/GspJ family protein n=1 Tax=Planococcus plakortidis TaxID=1038856 RepID=UPI003984C37B
MKLDEKGITLVELLAALILVSIIAVIAWTTITIGMRHGTSETNKTIMQQDMNLIMSSLISAHRNSEKYSVIFENNHLLINACDKSGDCKLSEIAGEYDFSESMINNIEINTSSAAPIVISDLNPSEKHIKVSLKITDINNEKNFIIVDTILSRILSKETEGGG